MARRSFIPRTKHSYHQRPDAARASEYAGFTPWRVDCVVWQSILDYEPVKLTIFCRAPSPAGAMHAARILWGRQIKEAKLRPGSEVPEFPKMDDRHDAECLDDADYATIWKDAQNWPRVWHGHPDNPLSFLFFPDIAKNIIIS